MMSFIPCDTKYYQNDQSRRKRWKRRVGRYGCRWKNDIKWIFGKQLKCGEDNTTDLVCVWLKGVDWINYELGNRLLGSLRSWESHWLAEEMLGFQEHISMELLQNFRFAFSDGSNSVDASCSLIWGLRQIQFLKHSWEQ